MATYNIYTELTLIDRGYLLSTDNATNFIAYIVNNHKKGKVLDTDILLDLFYIKYRVKDSYEYYKYLTDVLGVIYDMSEGIRVK